MYPIPNVTKPAADFAGNSYQLLYNLADSDYLVFWSGLVLLLLTVCSFLAHLPFPMRRLGKPLSLAPVAGETYSGKTLPIGGEQPITIEPVQD